MSKHDSNPKRDPLDENVGELLAQMAEGKVITDEGAVSVEEVEARRPKPSFTGTELLDDGQPIPKKAEPTPIAHDAPIADGGVGAEAVDVGQVEAAAEPVLPDGPISDSGAGIADAAGNQAIGADAQEAVGISRVNPLEDRVNTGEDPTSTPENDLGQIPVDSINSAESSADGGGPEAATVDVPDGTEPSDAEAVVAPAMEADGPGAGEPLPELADQLDSLLSGTDAAGQGAGEELAVESLEVEATDADSGESKDAGGTIESLNAELEAAAAKVGTGEGAVEVPGGQHEAEQTGAGTGPNEAEAGKVVEREPATEGVAATQETSTPVGQPAAPVSKVAAEAAAVSAGAAPVAVEPQGASARAKLRSKVGAAAGSAALSALALASSPLKNSSRGTRDTIGWVGLWTAFLGVCVWFYVLVLHTPAPAFVPAAAIHVVENAEEGGEGGGHGEKKPEKKEGGHEKAAVKPSSKPAAKSGGHEAPGGGHEKAKPAAKPASKPAKKADGHAAPSGH